MVCLFAFVLLGCLCLKQLGKFVGYLAHQLLIGCAAFGLLAKDARKDLHQIMLAMLMLLIVCVAQDATAQLQIARACLPTKIDREREREMLVEFICPSPILHINFTNCKQNCKKRQKASRLVSSTFKSPIFPAPLRNSLLLPFIYTVSPLLRPKKTGFN